MRALHTRAGIGRRLATELAARRETWDAPIRDGSLPFGCPTALDLRQGGLLPTTLVIFALVALCLSLVFGAATLRALRARRLVGSALRALLTALCLSLAALAATITVGIQGYRALTYEEVAATVKTVPLGLHHFRATIILPDRRLAMYDFAGDQFYVDARILKWHGLANLLGLHTSYELDRVAGRYSDVHDEHTLPHTAYTLARAAWVDLFFYARRELFRPLVDAEYGSAAFIAVTAPADYEVRVSTTGLLLRAVAARPSP